MVRLKLSCTGPSPRGRAKAILPHNNLKLNIMNYKTMSTKKLNAALANATDENEKAAIQQELNNREQLRTNVTGEIEQPKAPKAEEAPKAEQSKAPKKLSEVELHNFAETLKATNLHKRCEVVPFNTVDWVPGYIAGVVEDKRAGKVLYAIKCDDGRKIVKVHDSKLIKISDEKETVVRTTRAKSNEPKEALSPEAVAELKAKYQGNIGAVVEYAIDKEGTIETGRIVAFTYDTRACRLFYKIAVTAENEDGTKSVKWVHKVVGSDAIKVILPLDEEGEAINAKYLERASKERKAPATKAEKLAKLQERRGKLHAQLSELDAQIEALEAEVAADGEAVEDTTTAEDTTTGEDEELA